MPDLTSPLNTFRYPTPEESAIGTNLTMAAAVCTGQHEALMWLACRDDGPPDRRYLDALDNIAEAIWLLRKAKGHIMGMPIPPHQDRPTNPCQPPEEDEKP